MQEQDGSVPSAMLLVTLVVLVLVLGACAPVESVGQTPELQPEVQIRDGREAATDAAKRIAGVGIDITRRLRAVAQDVKAASTEATRADEALPPLAGDHTR